MCVHLQPAVDRLPPSLSPAMPTEYFSIAGGAMEQLGDTLHGGRRAVCICALFCGSCLLKFLSPVPSCTPAASGSQVDTTTRHLALVASEFPLVATSDVGSDSDSAVVPNNVPFTLVTTLLGIASLVVQLLRYRSERRNADEQRRNADEQRRNADELRARMAELAAVHAQELADVRASVLAATIQSAAAPPRRRAPPKARAAPRARGPLDSFLR